MRFYDVEGTCRRVGFATLAEAELERARMVVEGSGQRPGAVDGSTTLDVPASSSCDRTSTATPRRSCSGSAGPIDREAVVRYRRGSAACMIVWFDPR